MERPYIAALVKNPNLPNSKTFGHWFCLSSILFNLSRCTNPAKKNQQSIWDVFRKILSSITYSQARYLHTCTYRHYH